MKLTGTLAQRRAKRALMSASPATRRKWALKAARTRSRHCHERLRLCKVHVTPEAPEFQGRHELRETRPMHFPERFHRSAPVVLPSRTAPSVRLPVRGEDDDMYEGPVGLNPEMVIVHNPQNPFRHYVPLRLKRGTNTRRKEMRRRKHNFPVTAKIKGKKRGYRSFLKHSKGSLKQRIRAWKRAKKFHGGTRHRVLNKRHRRARKHNSWKGHKTAHRAAARKAWRKHRAKMLAGVRKGARRRKHGKRRK